MIWKRFFGAKPRNPDALRLYEAVVAQARRPGLYRDLGVPDTLDGRFEAIVLHLVLVLRRLKRDFPEGLELAGELQEVFFEDMRSEEHTSELQSLMRISYAVFCLKKKNKKNERSK